VQLMGKLVDVRQQMSFEIVRRGADSASSKRAERILRGRSDAVNRSLVTRSDHTQGAQIVPQLCADAEKSAVLGLSCHTSIMTQGCHRVADLAESSGRHVANGSPRRHRMPGATCLPTHDSTDRDDRIQWEHTR
jgi:hypothetical protein